MFGLSGTTTFFVFVTPVIGIILGLVYSLTFKMDKDTWWTLDELFKKD